MKRPYPPSFSLRQFLLGASLLLVLLIMPAFPAVMAADGGVQFHDFAAEEGSGITFERIASPRNAILDAIKAGTFQFPDDLARVPHKPHGAPGVAILDYDRDGDLDVYVTNGPGAPNALYSNQLRETGNLGFVDRAAAAGVDALDQDSNGVCFGDIDNDGDHDLLVLGAIEPNRLFENQGDGTFTDITESAGVGGGDLSTSSCTMGDVNGDGLLDVVVANTHTSWENLLGIVVPFTFNEHNQLFVNRGGNVFADQSAASGIETLAGLSEPGAPTLTWALALVDSDLDGDVDLWIFDDQGGVPPPAAGGVNYGLIHLLKNDGTGRFTDVTPEAGLAVPGNWMGASFGDFDCNGEMDFFATNAGDFPPGPELLGGAPPGVLSSRWFLARGNDTYVPATDFGALGGTPFGWGASTFDYDNDGDSDLVFHGAIDVGLWIDAGNPGAVLQNQNCTATFLYDAAALAESANHTRRTGQGLATGDLDGNGFVDLVTVSNFNIPDSVELTLRPPPITGGPFDATAFWVESFSPTPEDPTVFTWNGVPLDNGTLTLEINSGGNGNGSAEVTLLGGVGLIEGGRVNRDGIGAVVTFSTPGGKWQMVPVVGGASYASQDSLAVHVGLGEERRGTLEVLWPGGVRNRLYNVRAGERLVVPEIPCDVAAASADPLGYRQCVVGAVEEWVEAGVIAERDRARFLLSALGEILRPFAVGSGAVMK